MIKWFKKLQKIVREYNTLVHNVEVLEERLREANQLITDRTEVSVDVGVSGPSRIIVTGRYKNNDYVEIFDIPDNDFTYLVDILKGMRKNHVVRVLDGPFQMKSVLERVKDDLGGSW